MRDLSEIFGALADETRLRMLALLLEHEELCVCDLVAALEITQSKASRHLRTLRGAGLLQDRRDALWVHYRLAPALDPDRRAVMAALRRMVSTRDLGAVRERLRRWLERRAQEDACAPRAPRLVPLRRPSA